MSTPLCHRLLRSTICFFLPTLLFSQVIIREKVEIKPQPLPRSEQGVLPIRVESSFDGGVDPNLPQLIWLKGPCAVDVGSGNISGTLTAPAYDGAYKAGYRFTNPAGGSGGQFRFAVYLGDSLLREFRTAVSCPTGCTLFSEWDIRVYAGYTFWPQSAVIASGGTNTFGAVESTSTVPCSPGVWMSEWPIELEITKGQDVGSFVDGGKRSYTVVKKKSEFTTFGFLADGQKGYGDVEITARSGGITVVKGFKVVAPAPRVHIVPPWWWYGQPIKLSFDNLPILEFGETHTPGPGQKFEPVITWEPDDTINTADYLNRADELYVKVKAENAGGVARDSAKLVFQTECIKVNFEPEELSPGDTARLSLQRVREDGTLEDLPAGSYTFSVMIVGGEDSSRGLFVTEEEEPEGGTTLLYASAPILYIAPPSIPDTLLKVQVIGAAWEVIWGKKGEIKDPKKVVPGIQSVTGLRKEVVGETIPVGDGAPRRLQSKAAEAVMKAMASWCPINEVVVKNAAPTLTLIIPEPGEVWPTLRERFEGNAGDRNIKKMITVSVTRDGMSLSNYAVTIAAKMMLPSAGHEHANQPPQNLLGEFKDIRTKATGKSTITTVTDESGQIRLDFTAPEFSGNLEIKATSTTDNVEDKKELVVKVPNLVEFAAGGDYSLTGTKEGKHTKNHFFYSQTAKDELVKAAKEFADADWNTTGKIRLNDMSLESGGLFDLNAQWTNGDGHDSHRIGRSVDIENLKLEPIKKKSPFTGRDTTATKPDVEWVKRFKRFMEVTMKNWKFVPEGQTKEDVFDRTKRYPHFEWKGN
jgi:hypothetical protein